MSRRTGYVDLWGKLGDVSGIQFQQQGGSMKRTQLTFIPDVLVVIRDNNKYPSMLIFAKHHQVLIINREQIGQVVPNDGGQQ